MEEETRSFVGSTELSVVVYFKRRLERKNGKRRKLRGDERSSNTMHEKHGDEKHFVGEHHLTIYIGKSTKLRSVAVHWEGVSTPGAES